MTNTKTHRGSCICGLVQFEVDLDVAKATMCNCTFCMKLGCRAINTKPENLRALSDESKLARFGNDYAYRLFCPTCGIYCYGRGDIPEIGGPFASININTLDDIDPSDSTIAYWDGRHDNWDGGMRPTPWPVFREGEPRQKLQRISAAGAA